MSEEPSAFDQMRGQCVSCGRLGVALHGDDKCRTCWRLDNGDEEMERWDCDE